MNEFKEPKQAIKGLLCLLIFVPTQLVASNKLVLGLVDIPGLQPEANAGQSKYHQLLQHIPNKRTLFIPPGRAVVEFDKDYLDCIFPVSHTPSNNDEAVLISDHISSVNAYLFYRDKSAALSEDRVKNIAIRRGYSFGNIRAKMMANYIELNSEVQTLAFLKLGRVDAVVAYLPDIVELHRGKLFSMPYFDKNKPLHTEQEHFICHKSKKTQTFITKVNQLVRQGLYLQIASNH